MTIHIVPWDELTDEQRREWVKILVRFIMAGGETLPAIARRLRLEMAQRLEVRSTSLTQCRLLPNADCTHPQCQGSPE